MQRFIGHKILEKNDFKKRPQKANRNFLSFFNAF